MLLLTQISIFSGDKLSLSFLLCFYQWYFKGACGMRYSAIFQKCPWFPGKVPRLKVRYLVSEFSGWWVYSPACTQQSFYVRTFLITANCNCSHQLVKVVQINTAVSIDVFPTKPFQRNPTYANRMLTVVIHYLSTINKWLKQITYQSYIADRFPIDRFIDIDRFYRDQPLAFFLIIKHLG